MRKSSSLSRWSGMTRTSSAGAGASGGWNGRAQRERPVATLLQAVEVDVGVALRNILQISGISVDHFKFWVVLDIRDQLILADFIIFGADPGLLAAATVGGHRVDVPARFHVVCILRRS